MLVNRMFQILGLTLFSTHVCQSGSKPLLDASATYTKNPPLKASEIKLPLSRYKYQYSKFNKTLGQVDNVTIQSNETRVGHRKCLTALAALVPTISAFAGQLLRPLISDVAHKPQQCSGYNDQLLQHSIPKVLTGTPCRSVIFKSPCKLQSNSTSIGWHWNISEVRKGNFLKRNTSLTLLLISLTGSIWILGK